ncbi:hypothetical protein [Plasticicumulans sp.]|uniref:hypothetical protein n=1 Tax=Plasticicumulans sp. TaxID=2307179 RepID=UPI00393FAEB0|nr:hypothetical protein [Pseudomonadota bacterium]MBS0599637.1 hypothetical protein [Pseudomonadota bacterium]
MTIDQILPAVASLSHVEKFQLLQIVLQQLAEEEGITSQSPSVDDFEPRLFFGVAQHSRQAVDDYLASAREGWN